jgi:hypothetical protein
MHGFGCCFDASEMLTISRMLRCAALIKSNEGSLPVLKDYVQVAAQRKEQQEAIRKHETYKDAPLRYQLLEILPGQSMATVKLKYLLACRKHHPEVGGDPEMFLRVSLAYQDCMKDFGIETVDNKIVNLGNFQSCDHEMKNYLEARSRITSYIPLSTLDDHIEQLEGVHGRLGMELSKKLSDNSDDAFWLLEDIEKVVEATGITTVKVSMLEDGTLKVDPVVTPALEGTAPPLIGGSVEPQTSDQNTKSKVETSRHSSDAVLETEVTIEDLACLNAKHNVQKRQDVAGLASRVATGVMNNTKEKFQLRFETLVAVTIAFNLGFLILAYIDAYVRAKHEEDARPQVKEHITTDTMLPWWGNDSEYEAQVKRIFVDEWRRARSSSRRVQVFQDGVSRESLPSTEKEALDVNIFEVTAERLLKMRQHAEEQNGRQ